jgi:hypothetical protein
MATRMTTVATGPKTEAGKARSSKNALKHGLSTGYLAMTPDEEAEYASMREALTTALQPAGALEDHAFDMIARAAFRLRKIMRLIDALAAQYGCDPLIVPEAEAALKQLNRYRAAQEMAMYRGFREFEECQLRRAAHYEHCNPEEEHFLPAQVDPQTFAKADRTYDDRGLAISLSGLFAPGSSREPRLNELGYTEWVRKSPGKRKREIREYKQWIAEMRRECEQETRGSRSIERAPSDSPKQIPVAEDFGIVKME